MEAIIRLYDQGSPTQGESSQWSCLDRFYKVVPGEFTVVTGVWQGGVAAPGCVARGVNSPRVCGVCGGVRGWQGGRGC